jgi:hypothetical protein
MNTRQQSRLDHLNRIAIFTLTLHSLLLDGLHLSDLPGAIALAIWLWLPLCIRLEAQLLHRVRRKWGSAGSMGNSPSIPTTRGASH